MARYPIYQYYAELEGFKPKIWRRFQVMSNVTVARLGYIVMTMYEMTASHLLCIEHEQPFLTPGDRASSRWELVCRYDIPGEDSEIDGETSFDATKPKLHNMIFDDKSRLVVNYDFGDDWRVILKLEEKISDDSVSAKDLPRVLDGSGYGIIEDSGGPGGLTDLVEAFKAKKGSAYKEYRDWLGRDEFDIVPFDKEDMNFRLKKVPRIYKQIYEDNLEPTQRSVDLLERKYKR